MYSDLVIHLTYSGLRRAVGVSSNLTIVKSTDDRPACYKVITNTGEVEFHAVSSDVTMFLLRRSIGYTTAGCYPSMDTIDDIFD